MSSAYLILTPLIPHRLHSGQRTLLILCVLNHVLFPDDKEDVVFFPYAPTEYADGVFTHNHSRTARWSKGMNTSSSQYECHSLKDTQSQYVWAVSKKPWRCAGKGHWMRQEKILVSVRILCVMSGNQCGLEEAWRAQKWRCENHIQFLYAQSWSQPRTKLAKQYELEFRCTGMWLHVLRTH